MVMAQWLRSRRGSSGACRAELKFRYSSDALSGDDEIKYVWYDAKRGRRLMILKCYCSAMVRIVQASQGPRAPPTLLVAVARCDGGEKRRERVNGERKKAVLWRKELRC